MIRNTSKIITSSHKLMSTGNKTNFTQILSAHHSHHLRSHHLSLPRPFTPDLKLISFTNPFLHSLLIPSGLPSQIINLYRTKWALTFFVLVSCARLSWSHSASESTLNSSVVSYRIIDLQSHWIVCNHYQLRVDKRSLQQQLTDQLVKCVTCLLWIVSECLWVTDFTIRKTFQLYVYRHWTINRYTVVCRRTKHYCILQHSTL